MPQVTLPPQAWVVAEEWEEEKARALDLPPPLPLQTTALVGVGVGAVLPLPRSVRLHPLLGVRVGAGRERVGVRLGAAA